MLGKVAFSAMVAFCALPTGVLAGDTAQPPVQIAGEAPQLVYVNALPRGARTYHQGDVIMTAPLRWQIGARLPQETVIRAGSDKMILPAGSVLQAVVLSVTSSQRHEMAYCTRPDPIARRALGSSPFHMDVRAEITRLGVARQMDYPRFCLIDSDDVGIANCSVELNADSSAAQTPVAIPPVRLERVRMIAISDHDDRIEIPLNGVSSDGKSSAFQIDVIQRGKRLNFAMVGETHRRTFVETTRGLPARTDIYHTKFDVVSIDGANRSVVISWPADVDPKEAVTIADALRTFTHR